MRTPRAKMGTTSQRSASQQRYQNANESESIESAFLKAKQDMLLLVQDELLLKQDIQEVQTLFSKIMAQIDQLDNHRGSSSDTTSSIECSQTYARTNLNRNHNLRAAELGLPQLELNKYRIPPPQSNQFHDDESSSSYSQTESSLYPSDCAPSDASDFSHTNSTASRQTRSKKNSKRIMNQTYVIEPASEQLSEQSICEKSTFFDHTDLRSYTGFMPVLCSTFAGNLSQQTHIEPCADDASCAEDALTSAVALKRHLRNKQNNANQNEKSLFNDTARQNLHKKGILKNSSYYRACSSSLTGSDMLRATTSKNDNVYNGSLATEVNMTLGTRPSPIGAHSYELTQNSPALSSRRTTKVRFEDVSSGNSDGSCDSSSQSSGSDRTGKQRVKRLSKKPPTPKGCTPQSKKPAESSSDSEDERSPRKTPVRHQVSFADSIRDCASDCHDSISDSDTSLWLENSNEVFVDYETERQAKLAAMDSTRMAEIEDSSLSGVSDDTREEPVDKLPWLPQLAFEDSFKATIQGVENFEKCVKIDNNMTYNDNFALIAHIEKEFKKCREDGNGHDGQQDHLNVSLEHDQQLQNYACSEQITNDMPLNVSLNDSFPKHEKCVDHDVHLALGEPCSFYLEDTLTLLENSKLFELHMDQLSESGFESTHTLNSSVDSSQTDSSSIDSTSQKQPSLKPSMEDNPKPKVLVPPSLEVTRHSSPDMTTVQTPEETKCVFDDQVHTMCEMNFQGAPQTEYCESSTSSAYSSSSNASQVYQTVVEVRQVPFNTPMTSVEPTPDTSLQDTSKLIAPHATPASTSTSMSELMNPESTTATGSNNNEDMLTNIPPTEMLFSLALSPISSKASHASVAAPVNSPCASEDEEEEDTAKPIVMNSPPEVCKQLFPSPDGPPSPVIQRHDLKRQKLSRGSLFKIVRSNSKIRGKKTSSEDVETNAKTNGTDRHAAYKKKRDIKKKLKVFSNLFHRKDKDSMNQIQTLAHI